MTTASSSAPPRALIGLGFDGEEGAEAGALAGAAAAAEGIDVVEQNADWDVGLPAFRTTAPRLCC